MDDLEKIPVKQSRSGSESEGVSECFESFGFIYPEWLEQPFPFLTPASKNSFGGDWG
jgi:hypothetical protein